MTDSSSDDIAKRFFRRIGVADEDWERLTSARGVDDFLEKWVNGRQMDACSPATVGRLQLGLKHFQKQTSLVLRENENIRTNLQRLCDVVRLSKDSWELFCISRFGHGLEAVPASLSITQVKLLADKVSTLQFWRWNQSTNEMDLFLCESASRSDLNANKSNLVKERKMISLPVGLFVDLYDHQLTGIEYLVDSFHKKKGFLLADEMGLGKTRQVLVSYIALAKMGYIKRALLVVPPKLSPTWEKEFKLVTKAFGMGDRSIVYFQHISSVDKGRRNKDMRDARQRAEEANIPFFVAASSHFVGAPMGHDAKSDKREQSALYPQGTRDKNKFYDVIVVDEAHQQAKNDGTPLNKALTKSKLIENGAMLAVTATPIGNKIQDLAQILTLVTKSKRREESETNFVSRLNLKKNKDIIKGGQQKTARKDQLDAYNDFIRKFQKDVTPFILQRSIRDTLSQVLPAKTEYIVVVKPSRAQWDETKKLLETYNQNQDKDNKCHQFKAILEQRLIALHPKFKEAASDDYVREVVKEDNNGEYAADDDNALEGAEAEINIGDHSSIMTDAHVLQVAVAILAEKTNDNHKVLVFCEFRKVLNIFGKVLREREMEYHCIHGDVKIEEREKQMNDFNKNETSTKKIMLVSTRAGGTGLTLIGADTVLILGPNWNPTTDDQAVGRAYRIGQNCPVTVFRFAVASLIDEEILGKQIQKLSTINDVQSIMSKEGVMKRHFDDDELRKLLTMNDRNFGVSMLLERFQNLEKNKETNFVKGVPAGTVHAVMPFEAASMTGKRRFDSNEETASGIVERSAKSPKV